jgi:hypothetical protein
MKAGDLIRKKGTKTLRDGERADLIGLHMGEVPNDVTHDDYGCVRSTWRLDIFIKYASTLFPGRCWATSSEWEVLDETG